MGSPFPRYSGVGCCYTLTHSAVFGCFWICNGKLNGWPLRGEKPFLWSSVPLSTDNQGNPRNSITPIYTVEQYARQIVYKYENPLPGEERSVNTVDNLEYELMKAHVAACEFEEQVNQNLNPILKILAFAQHKKFIVDCIKDYRSCQCHRFRRDANHRCFSLRLLGDINRSFPENSRMFVKPVCSKVGNHECAWKDLSVSMEALYTCYLSAYNREILSVAPYSLKNPKFWTPERVYISVPCIGNDSFLSRQMYLCWDCFEIVDRPIRLKDNPVYLTISKNRALWEMDDSASPKTYREAVEVQIPYYEWFTFETVTTKRKIYEMGDEVHYEFIKSLKQDMDDPSDFQNMASNGRNCTHVDIKTFVQTYASPIDVDICEAHDKTFSRLSSLCLAFRDLKMEVYPRIVLDFNFYQMPKGYCKSVVTWTITHKPIHCEVPFDCTDVDGEMMLGSKIQEGFDEYHWFNSTHAFKHIERFWDYLRPYLDLFKPGKSIGKKKRDLLRSYFVAVRKYQMPYVRPHILFKYSKMVWNLRDTFNFVILLRTLSSMGFTSCSSSFFGLMQCIDPYSFNKLYSYTLPIHPTLKVQLNQFAADVDCGIYNIDEFARSEWRPHRRGLLSFEDTLDKRAGVIVRKGNMPGLKKLPYQKKIATQIVDRINEKEQALGSSGSYQVPQRLDRPKLKRKRSLKVLTKDEHHGDSCMFQSDRHGKDKDKKWTDHNRAKFWAPNDTTIFTARQMSDDVRTFMIPDSVVTEVEKENGAGSEPSLWAQMIQKMTSLYEPVRSFCIDMHKRIGNFFSTAVNMFFNTFPMIKSFVETIKKFMKNLYESSYLLKILLSIVVTGIVGLGLKYVYNSLPWEFTLVNWLLGLRDKDELKPPDVESGEATIGLAWIGATITGLTVSETSGFFKNLTAYNSIRMLIQDIRDSATEFYYLGYYAVTGEHWCKTAAWKDKIREETGKLDKMLELAGDITFEHRLSANMNWCDQVTKQINKWVEHYDLMPKGEMSQQDCQFYDRQCAAYVKLLSRIYHDGPRSRTRVPPLNIGFMTKDSRSGKDVTAQALGTILYQLMHEEFPDDYEWSEEWSDTFIYSKALGTEYWEGYRPGMTKIVHYSEYLNTFNSDDKCQQSRELLDLLDDRPMPLNWAGLEGKGCMYATHLINVVTSPVPAEEMFLNGLPQNNAVFKRFHVIIVPSMKRDRSDDWTFTSDVVKYRVQISNSSSDPLDYSNSKNCDRVRLDKEFHHLLGKDVTLMEIAKVLFAHLKVLKVNESVSSRALRYMEQCQKGQATIFEGVIETISEIRDSVPLFMTTVIDKTTGWYSFDYFMATDFKQAVIDLNGPSNYDMYYHYKCLDFKHLHLDVAPLYTSANEIRRMQSTIFATFCKKVFQTTKISFQDALLMYMILRPCASVEDGIMVYDAQCADNLLNDIRRKEGSYVDIVAFLNHPGYKSTIRLLNSARWIDNLKAADYYWYFDKFIRQLPGWESVDDYDGSMNQVYFNGCSLDPERCVEVPQVGKFYRLVDGKYHLVEGQVFTNDETGIKTHLGFQLEFMKSLDKFFTMAGFHETSTHYPGYEENFISHMMLERYLVSCMVNYEPGARMNEAFCTYEQKYNSGMFHGLYMTVRDGIKKNGLAIAGFIAALGTIAYCMIHAFKGRTKTDIVNATVDKINNTPPTYTVSKEVYRDIMKQDPRARYKYAEVKYAIGNGTFCLFKHDGGDESVSKVIVKDNDRVSTMMASQKQRQNLSVDQSHIHKQSKNQSLSVEPSHIAKQFKSNNLNGFQETSRDGNRVEFTPYFRAVFEDGWPEPIFEDNDLYQKEYRAGYRYVYEMTQSALESMLLWQPFESIGWMHRVQADRVKCIGPHYEVYKRHIAWSQDQMINKGNASMGTQAEGEFQIRAGHIADNIVRAELSSETRSVAITITFIGERQAMCPKHYFLALPNWNVLKLYLHDTGNPYQFGRHEVSIEPDPQRDFCRLEIKSKVLPFFKNIYHRLPDTIESVSRSDRTCRIFREVNVKDGKVYITLKYNETPCIRQLGYIFESRYRNLESDAFEQFEHANYFVLQNAPTVIGECGNPVCNLDGNMHKSDLFGMIVANMHESCVIVPVSKEDFPGLAKISIILPTERVFSVTDDIQKGDAAIDGARTDVMVYPLIPGTFMTSMVSPVPIFMPTKNAHRPSPIYFELEEFVGSLQSQKWKRQKIPVHPTALGVKARENAFLRLSQRSGSVPIPENIHRMLNNDIIFSGFGNNNKGRSYSIRSLYHTLFAHNGLTSLDTSKSATFDFKILKKNRKDMWGHDNSPFPEWVCKEDPERLKWINPALRKMVNRLISEIESPDSCKIQGMSEGCLKDELTLIEKWENNKTRIFCVSSVLLAILCKMLLGDYMGNHSAIDSNCVKIGINAYSRDWEILYQDLVRFVNLIGGDFSGWDYSILCLFQDTFGRWMYSLPWDDSSKRRARKWIYALSDSVVGFYMIVGAYIVRRFQGVSSGHYWTSLFNSFVNFVIFRLAFYSLVPKEYHDKVIDYYIMIFYGDDNGGSVSKNIEQYFNMETIAKFFLKTFGMEYTNPDKGKISDLFLNITDFTFLSRKFEERDGMMNAPLEPDAIIGMLAYIRKPTEGNTVAGQLDQNIETALRELIHYPRDVYEMWCEFFESIRNKYQSNFKIHNWELAMDYRRQDYFG